MTEALAFCGAGLCAFFAISVVREMRREYTVTIVTAVCIIFLAYIIPRSMEAVNFIKTVAVSANSEYISILIRALGITYLTSISGEICRSSGEGTVAGYIECAGRVELLLLSVPLFSELLELAHF